MAHGTKQRHENVSPGRPVRLLRPIPAAYVVGSYRTATAWSHDVRQHGSRVREVQQSEGRSTVTALACTSCME